MLLDPNAIARLWEQARSELNLKAADAVFLEGSIAEGFGNDRSDIDFVAVIDDGSDVPTMPYIVFAEGRRIEVRYLTSEKIARRLRKVRRAVERGPGAMARLSWDLLDRCQRFMRCFALTNPELIARLQRELGAEALQKAVIGWFEDFARQTGRFAVAMLALHQDDYARAWIRTAALYGAKSYVARRGETYLGPKWLSLQLDRADVAKETARRVWQLLHQELEVQSAADYVRVGVELLAELEVPGVDCDQSRVHVGLRRGVTTWQIGERIHVARGDDLFALSATAGEAWRSVVGGTACTAILGRVRDDDARRRRGAYLADFNRAGLITLLWDGAAPIRARHRSTSGPVSTTPLISFAGAQPRPNDERGLSLLPMPARRFAEAGMELTWANMGLENALEDALGAEKRGQWRVLHYSLERMSQMAALVALSAFGVTPMPPLEEATLEAIRLLRLDQALADDLRTLERAPISSAEEAARHRALATSVTERLRGIAGHGAFPASFDSASGWRGTMLIGFDWINMMTYLDARFPMTSPGGRGTLEEARDVLAAGSR